MRAVAKGSPSASSNGERQETLRDPPKQRPHLQVEIVCQRETIAHDPFWDGPRLVPVFVTQLLGQVMPGERNRFVRGAYGEAGASARLLDTRL